MTHSMEWLVLDQQGTVIAVCRDETDADKIAYALEAASFEPASRGAFKVGEMVPVWHS